MIFVFTKDLHVSLSMFMTPVSFCNFRRCLVQQTFCKIYSHFKVTSSKKQFIKTWFESKKGFVVVASFQGCLGSGFQGFVKI